MAAHAGFDLRAAMRALAAVCAATWLAPAASHAGVAVAWNTPGGGSLRSMSTSAPWGYTTPLVTGGANVTLRFAHGRLYALSRSDATLRELDPTSGALLRTWQLAPGSEPLDVALVSPSLAWISRATTGALLQLDLETGAVVGASDLSDLADADGNPDLGMLALHEGRLFVQVRRQDSQDFQFVPPAQIAVLDAATGARVDTDPVTPGTQTIVLQGTAPKLKMQIVESTRSLFVSATGRDFDAGGIERIDLDTLQSQGLVLRESDGQTGSDLGAFVFTHPGGGFLTFTTDLALSSHLLRFSLAKGVLGSQLFVVLGYFVPTLAHDPVTDTLYFPRGGSPDTGVLVFDATTGEQLSETPTPTDGAPSDLAVTCTCGDAACSGGSRCLPALPPVGRTVLGAALLAAALSIVLARRRWVRCEGRRP